MVRCVGYSAAMNRENLDFDRLVHEAWPALHQEESHGWVLRHADGVTKRANSVLPWAEPADQDAAIDAAEKFYAGHGLPCVFSMGGRAPAPLDGLLAARGYRVVDETDCMVAPLAGEIAPAAHEVTISEDPSEDWLAAWWSVDGRFGADGAVTAGRILTGVPASYAAVERDGRPVAVGRSVLQDGILGIYCMATIPGERRRGLGGSVLRALLAHGRARGAGTAYLVVVAANRAATALYAREGFNRSGGYRYRVR